MVQQSGGVGVVGARGQVRGQFGHAEAEDEPLAQARGRDDRPAGLGIFGDRARGGLGEVDLLDEREGAEGARRAGEEVASARRCTPKTSVVAAGVGSTIRPRPVSETWRRSESMPKEATRPPSRT